MFVSFSFAGDRPCGLACGAGKAGGISEAGHSILERSNREESSAARGENASLTRERRTHCRRKKAREQG